MKKVFYFVLALIALCIIYFCVNLNQFKNITPPIHMPISIHNGQSIEQMVYIDKEDNYTFVFVHKHAEISSPTRTEFFRFFDGMNSLNRAPVNGKHLNASITIYDVTNKIVHDVKKIQFVLYAGGSNNVQVVSTHFKLSKGIYLFKIYDIQVSAEIQPYINEYRIIQYYGGK